MEQTLGKRIAENRKRLKLTQDQLAEQLGITAQAVSKWENDQSCPDITMLPRLARIFGITTDQLLGAAPADPVFQAEVVEDQQVPGQFNFEMNSDKGKGTWAFHWDSGKRGAMTFGILVLWVGALTLLCRINRWDVSFWSILWPSAGLIYGLAGVLRKFSVFSLGLALFCGYSLVANLGIWQLDLAGELVFPVMLLLFGVGLLADALRKPNRSVFRVTRNGRDAHRSRCDCDGEGGFRCDLSFGERTFPVNVPVLVGGEATVSFGELTVDLTGCESVAEDCRIRANCSFGELQLLVPRCYRVEARAGTAFANLNVVGHPDPEPAGVIILDADASFGEISIRYI